MASKRKRTYAPRRAPFKRRRTRRVRRRKYGGGNNVTGNTTKANVGSISYKTKRLSRRAFRSALWRDTLFSTKYKSSYAVAYTDATVASAVATKFLSHSALKTSAGDPFWTTNGGLQPNSSGGSVQAFIDGKLVLRGGQTSMAISNIDSTSGSSIGGYMFLLATSDLYTDGNFNGISPTRDPQSLFTLPDFQQRFGRVLCMKEFMIRDGDSIILKHRLKIRQIDTTQFTNNQRAYTWGYCLFNYGGSVAQNVSIYITYDLAFCADAVA